VNAEAPFGGGTFIADKSVWARAHRGVFGDEWDRALVGGQIATCHINSLELLYSTRSAADFAALEEELGALPSYPTTTATCEAAITALRELSARTDGYHRVMPPDALIAACAAEAGIGVLHYDHHYDRLAEVLAFESRWIAAAGSID
jgi:predicted nucleic acid-binding protein